MTVVDTSRHFAALRNLLVPYSGGAGIRVCRQDRGLVCSPCRVRSEGL